MHDEVMTTTFRDRSLASGPVWTMNQNQSTCPSRRGVGEMAKSLQGWRDFVKLHGPPPDKKSSGELQSGSWRRAIQGHREENRRGVANASRRHFEASPGLTVGCLMIRSWRTPSRSGILLIRVLRLRLEIRPMDWWILVGERRIVSALHRLERSQLTRRS